MKLIMVVLVPFLINVMQEKQQQEADAQLVELSVSHIVYHSIMVGLAVGRVLMQITEFLLDVALSSKSPVEVIITIIKA